MDDLLLDWRNTREWEKTYLKSDEWETIGELPVKIDGYVVALLHSDTEKIMPWCIEYHGNGHYYPSKKDAEEYVTKRWGNRKGIYVGDNR